MRERDKTPRFAPVQLQKDIAEWAVVNGRVLCVDETRVRVPDLFDHFAAVHRHVAANEYQIITQSMNDSLNDQSL